MRDRRDRRPCSKAGPLKRPARKISANPAVDAPAAVIAMAGAVEIEIVAAVIAVEETEGKSAEVER